MSSRVVSLAIWLTEGKRNLAEFQRSPFHDTLRTEIRDHYTNLFENFPKETLAKVEALLRAAKIEEPLSPSMSARDSPHSSPPAVTGADMGHVTPEPVQTLDICMSIMHSQISEHMSLIWNTLPHSRS